LHNPGLINPNLVDSHAVFSLFGIGRRGWQRKLLPIADKATDCQRSTADASPEMLPGTCDHEINATVESVPIRSEQHKAPAKGLVAVIGWKINKRPRGIRSNKCFAK
jgi:hypothetical protein